MTYLIDTADYDESFYEKIRAAVSRIYISDKTERVKDVTQCGRALLGYMLKKLYHKDNFSYFYGENGKPYLKNEDIFFNISHSGTAVICTVSDSETGCDIQQLTPYKERVALRFFAENEFSLLSACSDKEKTFTKLWAMKEAVLKKNGTGITGGLSEYDFSEYTRCESFTAYGSRFVCGEYADCEICICDGSENEKIYVVSADELEAYLDSVNKST